MLQEGDFEHLDPGIAYYSVDYKVVFATQRPLYSNKPNTASTASPDMASGPPEISSDNKPITVHMREGVKFSPPVNREVTAEDVAYAFQRATNPNVANPYIGAYFKSIEGEPQAEKEGGAKPIKGITTPNKHTIVFKLTEPKAQFVAAALVMPISAAVPKEYAEKYDKNKPSNYASYEVATGPYMIKNDSSGKVLGVGYFPGKSLTLVRNPNWNASTDIRPGVSGRNRRSRSAATTRSSAARCWKATNIVQSEPPTQANIKLAAEKYKSQLEISPGAGSHYIGVNNKSGPFKNENLRKAMWAALDRSAMDKARGGQLVTNVMTHWLYPSNDPVWNEVIGFNAAGGLKGPKFDFNEHPEGDMAVADKYMKKAGYPSGKYTGGETVTIVGAKGAAGRTGRGNRQLDAQEPGLQHEVHARRNVDDVREVLQRPERRNRRLPERWVDRRLRRPADGPQHHVQRQVDRADGERQLEPGERPRTEQSDVRSRKRERQGRAREGLGRNRHETGRKSDRGSVRLGQAGRTSRAKTSTA